MNAQCRIGMPVSLRNLAVPWLLLTLLALLLVTPASASLATKSRLFQVPADEVAGFAAGQLKSPAGLAADPDTGHIFVPDQGNNRVSEFTAWGEFVKAWGWGVATGAPQLQTCGPGAQPPTSTCLSGLAGSGPGQFSDVRGGLAIDSAGDIWVGDLLNNRVQKFDPDGKFLLMVGGQVDKGPGHPGNLCTAAYLVEGDTCGAGTPGSGNEEFQATALLGNNLAASASGDVYVGDIGRVQRFALDGSFVSEIALEAPYATSHVKGIAPTATGDLYLLLGPSSGAYADKVVEKVDASGAVVSSIPLTWKPTALALDSEDNLYVAITELSPGGGFQDREVIAYGPTGTAIIPLGEGIAQSKQLALGAQLYYGLAANTVTAAGGTDIYLSVLTDNSRASLRAYGAPPDRWAPPAVPPVITSQYATAVGVNSAVVSAEINPRYWDDTTYSVEYGTGECESNGCPLVLPAEPALLNSGVVSEPIATAGITLPGLLPGTTYHYRFTAESSGGGPVVGVGVGEAESTFHTPSLPALEQGCPNQAFRVGPAARLPNCRAYEMVSPVNKNGADILPLINFNGSPAVLDQSSLDGSKLTYSDYQAFGNAQGAPYVSQYIASRGANGWDTTGITPRQGLSPVPPSSRLDIEFWDFSPDLCASALVHSTDAELAPGGNEGLKNLYKRQNCGTVGYETLSTIAPPVGLDPLFYLPAPQGMSDDGRCTVFTIYAPRGDVYVTCDGQVREVSSLPNGNPTTEAAVGSPNNENPLLRPRIGAVATAYSSDGTRVYWSDQDDRVYVRTNADSEQSALSGSNCTEPEKACTVRVSQAVSGAGAHFWAASSDGSKAFFTITTGTLEGNLYEFTLGGSATKIAGGFVGMIGGSDDGSRFVFASTQVLTSAPNSEGDVAVAGKNNLYHYNATKSGEERFQFVGLLSEADAAIDAVNKSFSPLALGPYRKTSRINGSGDQFIFNSDADLTGYDNTDVTTGEADAEVYFYDATAASGAGRILCVSCNPSGQRPSGRLIQSEYEPSETGTFGTWTAAIVPPYATEMHGSRVISSDGKKAYFNSYDALLPSDTNDKADVYQWQSVGSGDCKENGSGYSAASLGCLSLISTGESESDSEFVDTDAGAGNVFFRTASTLVSQDPGQYDIYDAREGGGYPTATTPPDCFGEACQVPQNPPGSTAPGTGTAGPGNVKKPRPYCGKGRHAVKKKGKWRCVDNKKKKGKSGKGKGKKRANASGGSSK